MNEQVYRVLIVEDEPLARDYLVRLFSSLDKFRIVGEAQNGQEGLELCEKLMPDLMMLDVQMPGLDGFTLLRRLPSNQLPPVIFTTAFEEYAIQAFEHHAIDYLLKPFDQNRFGQAIEHSLKLLENKRLQKENARRILDLLEHSVRSFLERIPVKQNGKVILVDTSTISCIEADDKYLYLHTESARYMVRRALKRLLGELDPRVFVRSHRSFVVNLDHIKELHQAFKGEYRILLKNGKEIPLSRSYKHRLFDLLGKPL